MLKTRVNGTVRPEMDAGLRRGIAAAVVLLLVCVLAVGVVSADEVTVSSFAELWSNISSAPSERTIVVANDIAVSGSDAIPAITTNITLTTNNENHKIYRTEANTTIQTGMFIIQNDGKLTIQGNNSKTLTLDGNQTEVSDNRQPLVRVGDGGNFTLMDGGILTNNTAGFNDDSDRGYGGGVYVGSGGTFTMSGGILTNNTADDGGGVYVDYGGTFTMSGGILTNNTADDGGGVYVHPGTFDTGGSVYVGSGTFEMSGGEISGNKASYGGGVYVDYGGTFTMSDNAAISGNEASYGGGVYVDYGGTFTMSDNAAISGNEADEGGGVYMLPGTFKMSGGEISGNNAVLCGGGVCMFGGTFTMSDNAAISDNTADDGGGVYVDSGTFELSGRSSVDSVYLASGKSITVTEELTGTDPQVTGIKLESLADDTEVVTGKLRDSDIFKFKLDLSVTEYELKYQSPNSIVLKQLPGPAPLPPSGGSSSDGNMENAFRVLFNDGATTLTVQTDLSYGDKLTKPEDPVKDGYTFAGWHKDSACTQGWDFETGIPGDMTLYAKWTAAGSSGETEATATPTKTQTAVTTPHPTATQTAAATTSAPEATTAAGVSPTLTQAPAPVAGALFGLLAAGVLLRRRFQ